MKKAMMLVAAIVMISTPCFSWEGWDYETNNAVEIEKGNTVRRGKDIQIFNYGTGRYNNATVERVQRRGNTVEVEVFDHDSGTFKTFEMQD